MIFPWLIPIESKDFHFTGSRFFGNYHENSDWDLFTDNISEFERISSMCSARPSLEGYNGKMDEQTLTVREYSISDKGIVCQLVLVKDVSVKLAAQEIIKNQKLFLVDKIHQKEIWNSAYKLAELSSLRGKE